MANLSFMEKEQFEILLGMASGFVSDFSDRTFKDFFWTEVKINIDHSKYQINGSSKAKRLRAFWDAEPDIVVGKALAVLVQREKLKSKQDNNIELIKFCECVAARLLGKQTKKQEDDTSEDVFLKKEFKLNLNTLNIEGAMIPVLEQRLKEIQLCLKSKASLSVIFLVGSTLEGLLLSAAMQNPKGFNSAAAAPKKDNKVLKLNEWSLNNLVNVSYELKVIGKDVKEFSHALRDFRNYIHPYAQMACSFEPDEHTAIICWQVLKAAIADLSK